jgi:ferredoxin-NADP reductase
LPGALPGQFVAVRLDLEDQRPPTSRSYSLSGPPGSPDYRVSVKREPHGVFSAFVHDRVRPGNVLEIAAPRGRFTLSDADSPVLLISAGIGATPVLSMLYALAQSGSARKVWWLHGARNSTEHVFAAEARTLIDQLSNARVHVCYSAPLPTDILGAHYTHRGRVDAGFVRSLLIPRDAHAYVCGPAAFMDDVQAALTSVGLDQARVHSEVFGAGPRLTPGIADRPVAPPHPPAGQAGDGPIVTFARSGLSVPYCGDFISILELAEACDISVRWSCRTGVCHSCEAGLLAGTVSYDPPPVDLPADGHVLVFCAVPDDDVALDL